MNHSLISRPKFTTIPDKLVIACLNISNSSDQKCHGFENVFSVKSKYDNKPCKYKNHKQPPSAVGKRPNHQDSLSEPMALLCLISEEDYKLMGSGY